MEYEDFQAARERERRERKEWLQSLKNGDTVAVYRSGWGTPRYDLFLVKRTTTTQIVCTQILQTGFAVEVKYRKEDGRQVGSDDYATIEAVTDKVRVTNRRYFLECWFAGLNRKNLSTECLEAMYNEYQLHDTKE